VFPLSALITLAICQRLLSTPPVKKVSKELTMDTCSMEELHFSDLGESQDDLVYSPLVLLENEWTFWFDKYPGPGLSFEQYASSLTRIGTINTVQAFWQYYNNLPSPDDISISTSYHLMKSGSLPLWEDRNNWEGGSIAIKVKKDVSEPLWMALLLCAIGEQFNDGLHDDDSIQGVSINVRKQEDMLLIWNKRADLLNIKKLLDRIKKYLPSAQFLGEPAYRVHKTEVSNATPAKNKHEPMKYKNNVDKYLTKQSSPSKFWTKGR